MKKKQRLAPIVNGIYVINGPEGVYVGEAADCWTRSTLALAARLGWDCGIIRETPGFTRLERMRVETTIAKLFEKSGINVVSHHIEHTSHKHIRARKLASSADSFDTIKKMNERSYILDKLKENHWNISETSRVLLMARSNLNKKIKQYQLTKDTLS